MTLRQLSGERASRGQTFVAWQQQHLESIAGGSHASGCGPHASVGIVQLSRRQMSGKRILATSCQHCARTPIELGRYHRTAVQQGRLGGRGVQVDLCCQAAAPPSQRCRALESWSQWWPRRPRKDRTAQLTEYRNRCPPYHLQPALHTGLPQPHRTKIMQPDWQCAPVGGQTKCQPRPPGSSTVLKAIRPAFRLPVGVQAPEAGSYS